MFGRDVHHFLTFYQDFFGSSHPDLIALHFSFVIPQKQLTILTGHDVINGLSISTLWRVLRYGMFKTLQWKNDIPRWIWDLFYILRMTTSTHREYWRLGVGRPYFFLI
jgi:hypothetical protein